MRGIIIGTALVLAACGDNLGSDTPELAGASLTTDEDAPVTHTVEATDPDGRALVLNAQPPSHGAVSIDGLRVTYTPGADYHGTDSFTVTVSNGMAQASARIDVTVRPVNDVPAAAGDSFAATEDTPLVRPASALLANDSDVDGDVLSLMSVHDATNGTVSAAGGDVTFTPAADFTGMASFQYTVSDGAATATATVMVAVGGVNDAPVAVDDSASTQEDTPLGLPGTGLVTNDTDVEGQALTVTAVGNATNGTVELASGIATFTPAADFNGTATFEYTVSDGADTDVGTVTITVGAVNDAPVAVDDAVTTPEDTPLVVTAASLAGNDTDVDGPSLSISDVGGAINGSVALAAGDVTFTPDPNFNGMASFTYTLTDGTAIDTGVVTVTVTPVNDAPVAGDDAGSIQAPNPITFTHADLLANDTDIDGPSLAVIAVQNAVNGAAVLGATTVTFTPDPGFEGAASFEYVVSDGTDTDVGAVAVTVSAAPVCGDGVVAAPEVCDDGDTAGGDGCDATCAIEPGWNCTGSPSACTTICNDGIVVGGEPCDDGNLDETDGCTTMCVVGVPCNGTDIAGADRFAVDPATGHCYASFDGESTTFAGAQSACVAAGGYLATITSAAEQGFANAAQNPAENPWIGAIDDANDTDAIFDWVTDEPFGFAAFVPGQPDDDATIDGNGECLHMFDANGLWNDTNCNITTFVVGRICELEPEPCGDSVHQPVGGEECDDGNTGGGDGCSATCQLEDGCGDGNLDPGEECDDDNPASGDGCSATCQVEDGCGDGNLDAGEQCDDDGLDPGDGCSATCQKELLASFTFTGGTGDEPSAPADGTAPAPGIDSIPVISRGAGLTPSPATNAFSSSFFTLGAAVDPTDYYTLTVTPAAGFTMSLLGLELDERRSSTGIRSWVVRSSLDGFTADLATFTVPDDTLIRTNQPIPLGPAFRNLATPVEFRIYAFAGEGDTGTWRLDNIELNGFTTGP